MTGFSKEAKTNKKIEKRLKIADFATFSNFFKSDGISGNQSCRFNFATLKIPAIPGAG